ncbi:MAG TPA: hypothetical protein VFQ45_19990 [Longimicrobium sp.]|nr:hypothetical protein [Longimicrobium sp.]
MAHRTLSDGAGRAWEVWDTVPTGPRHMVHPEFADGWLTFQATDGAEKRRLAPIPVGWAGAPDAELAALLARARPVRGPSAPPPR